MAGTFTLASSTAEMRLLTVVNRGNPNWFVVRVIGGTVRLQHWPSPTAGAGEIDTSKNIADGLPHRVELSYAEGVFTVSVDGQVVITAANSYIPSVPGPFVFAGGECIYGFWGIVGDMIVQRLN